jgi:hypothetical protein
LTGGCCYRSGRQRRSSWQHWLSPQIEFGPEMSYWRSIGTPAFNGNSVKGIPGNKRDTGLFAADVIFHF